MTNLRKAAEMALEALNYYFDNETQPEYPFVDDAVTALRQALEKPEQGCGECGKKASEGWALYCVKCAEEFCDTHCTWLDHHQDCVRAEPEQEPVAWATFDGEGNYDFRSYENNETYRDEYIKQNGNKYANWVKPLYTESLNLKQDTNKVCEKLCSQARRTERGACHQIVWDYGFSRIDNEEVQAACADLARAIQARGKND